MEFKESYFITSDGARIFYRYRLASDVACENQSAYEINLSEDGKFDGSNLSAGTANETSNLTDEQIGGADENTELNLNSEGKSDEQNLSNGDENSDSNLNEASKCGTSNLSETPSENAEQNLKFKAAPNAKAVAIFHRGHEHSGRTTHVADGLADESFSYFAWDQRGHGRSDGERGDAPSIGRLIADVDEFVAHIEQRFGFETQNLAVIAQSVGAVLVSAWLHDYAVRVRCAVLASPAFSVKLYVPFARAGLKALYSSRGNFFVNSYVRAHYLTHDKDRQASYDADSLITRAISVRILLELYEAAQRVVSDAAAITTPTLLLISGDDWVVEHAPQHEFYNALGARVKRREILEGFYHDTLGESERERAFEIVREFVGERFSAPFSEVDCTHADEYGFSREEADRLATPLPRFSPKNLRFKFQRIFMQAVSPWVGGLKIGENTGYDSGSTLDYVYRNEPQGANKFFKFIDKFYLNAIGWRGIRERKRNIKLAIDQAVAKLQERGEPLRLLDIASGHGRYILDAAQGHKFERITLRDYSDINVKAGSEMIKERGLQDVASFTQANAFEAASYDGLQDAYTLGVVSGLFELFPDNSVVRTALQGFSSSVKSGGYLIYTNQPWHPQLEMIARALSSHRQGAAWIMRRRSQAEMDQLVENAGFKKVKEWIDGDGIFSVSLAVKI
ncbi:bifunctional alpha/beta hydrolase/class I SAM-dependent methyltransferase [uncultured Campylobacter sp.]|uniref:bifunctional alpha/beta hydrolase/class I SAM-dependent methyltransferase n=3 Tax=uncultured Campylobacter sp. TaxID=218934 RepID=UPI002627B909|nr:bifunctional alpha/beta hydrolase/class I SAM-dependent methyltransferase [uncultured Campylobacter sp.]